jgi:O-antigen/teichoic acid export membrane protein
MTPGAPPRRRSTVTGFVFVTGSTLVGGVLGAVLIALAARRGEIGEIAAYTVMSGVLALVGVAVGGGGSMLYLGGTDGDRQAVRSQRVLAVLPALVVAALAVLAVYGPRGYPAAALLATAATFVANNLAELPLAQLHRDLRFHLIAAPTLTGKVVALAAFAVGLPVTGALLVGAVVNLAAFEAIAGRSGLVAALLRDRPTRAAALRAFRSGRGLYAYTLAELFALRVPGLGLSLVVPVAVMGVFGAVATAFQAVLTVFQSGLNMVLSLRAQATGRRSDAELLTLGAGLLATVVITAAAPWLTARVLGLAPPEAAEWLRVLGLALPFFLVNRIAATHAIGDGHHGRAAGIAAGLAVSTTAALAVTTTIAGATGGALATLLGEAGVAVALLGVRLGARR